MSLTLTENAANRIRNLLVAEENPALNLRVFVSGGGCSGYQYGFAFDEEVNADDNLIESQNVKMLIDNASLQLMNGAEIDFKESLQESSFVIRNPNAASGCGCGKSFTPREGDEGATGGCANRSC